MNHTIPLHGSIYAKSLFEIRLRITRNMLDEIGVDRDSTIVDVGCGEGFVALMYKIGESPQILGFDINKEAIENAKKTFSHCNFFVADAQNVSLNIKVDAVVACEVIEHLKKQEQALKRWVELLKDGGYLILSTPNRATVWRMSKQPPHHQNMLTLKKILNLLRNEQLRIIKIVPLDFPFPLRYKLFRIDSLCRLNLLLPRRLNEPKIANDVIYLCKYVSK